MPTTGRQAVASRARTATTATPVSRRTSFRKGACIERTSRAPSPRPDPTMALICEPNRRKMRGCMIVRCASIFGKGAYVGAEPFLYTSGDLKNLQTTCPQANIFSSMSDRCSSARFRGSLVDLPLTCLTPTLICDIVCRHAQTC